MINYEKTRLMTKCSIYEKKNGKEDIKMSAYYKSDYVRLNIVKTIVYATIGFLFCFLLYAIYNMNVFLEQAFYIDYQKLGYTLLGIYIAIIAVFIAFTWVGYSSKYRMSRARLAKYYKLLGKINKLNEEDERIKDLEE